MKTSIKINSTGITPGLVGRVKDHKQNIPLRPIVPRCVASHYFIERSYVPFLKSILPVSNRTICSTEEFISKIKVVQLKPGTIIASLDVVSLFLSIGTKNFK